MNEPTLESPEQHSQQAPLNYFGAMGLTTPVMRKKVEENYIYVEFTKAASVLGMNRLARDDKSHASCVAQVDV